MEKIIHNIKKEKKLVEILGYHLSGPDNSNRWLITDDNNNKVGFIQYKKICKKNVKKGHSAIFGYQIEINTKEIKYIDTRKLNNQNNKTNLDKETNYELDIIRENGNIDHLEISVGKYPGLTLWSKDYGFMNFKIDYQGLHLNFKSKTDNFKIEEVLIYKNNTNTTSVQPKEYIYQLRYCDKNINLDSDNQKEITIREIIGRCTQNQQYDNQIKLIENTWVNNKLKTTRENLVTGTLDEMVKKHKMGIDSFNHFRFLINQILPFKQEVISSILEQYLGKRKELALFIPELGISNEEIIEQNHYVNEETNLSKPNHNIEKKLIKAKKQ